MIYWPIEDFFDDVQYFLLTFLVVCIFCNFLQFAIKWHDAWPMFFAQVTLHDLFMYLVFVSWCDDVHIFYSWLGTWSIHVLMYLYLSLIFIRMFSTNLGGNVKQYSMTEKKWSFNWCNFFYGFNADLNDYFFVNESR